MTADPEITHLSVYPLIRLSYFRVSRDLGPNRRHNLADKTNGLSARLGRPFRNLTGHPGRGGNHKKGLLAANSVVGTPQN